MLRAIAIGLPVFLLLDGIWLGVVAKGFYARQLGPWLRTGPGGEMAPLWAPALAFYALVVVGIAAFVLPRVSAAGGGVASALGWGALFGLVVYSAWDLTNYSVLKDWPLPVTLADLAWGATICAITTAAMVIARN
jgi:uncharacterized membrane protein